MYLYLFAKTNLYLPSDVKKKSFCNENLNFLKIITNHTCSVRKYRTLVLYRPNIIHEASQKIKVKTNSLLKKNQKDITEGTNETDRVRIERFDQKANNIRRPLFWSSYWRWCSPVLVSLKDISYIFCFNFGAQTIRTDQT